MNKKSKTIIAQNHKQKTGLKIAMLGHKRIPSREGGVEIVVEELSKRLVHRGHNVHALNRSGHHVSGVNYDRGKRNMKEYAGIKLITIPTFQSRQLNALVYSVNATFRALFGRYDCIHYHAEGPCAMLWLPHLLGIRTVATIHGLDWQRAKWGGFATRYLKFGEKIAARYADEVIVLSKNVQQYFLNTYSREVRFIPNAVDPPERRSAKAIKEKWNLEKDNYILYLGRLVPEKGLHYLIDAFQETNTTRKLVVAGGSSHTDDYMTEIRKKAEGDARIIFTNFVQGEELQELYSNAYLYVLPSDLEGMPISLLEAMSYGNCCVVSDIPECSEVVEDKAVIFNKGSIPDLKAKLEELLTNPDLVSDYKRSAASFICSKYNWNSVVEMTLSLYAKKQKTPNYMKENEGML